LLSVLAVVVLLAVIRLPALANAKGKARVSLALHNLEQVCAHFLDDPKVVKMKPRPLCSWAQDRRALTLIELTMIVALLGVLGALLLPALARPRTRVPGLVCVNNLKNIGLAFRVFATDNNDQYPMQLSLTNFGSLELLGDAQKVWVPFSVLSNELSTPKILLCPADRFGRVEAAGFFTNGGASSGQAAGIPFASNRNLSYFLGVDATAKTGPMLLSGDRSLTNDFPSPFRFGEAMVGSLGTNHTASRGAGWDKRVHRFRGNVCLGDGGVQQTSEVDLRTLLRNSGDTQNRIASPD
jgi:type II secretory pathway pseudopilin PulG